MLVILHKFIWICFISKVLFVGAQKIEIKTETTNLTVPNLGYIRLSCFTVQNFTSYRWECVKNVCVENNQYDVYVEKENVGLQLHVKSKRMKGKYTCLITTEREASIHEYNINVIGPLVFLDNRLSTGVAMWQFGTAIMCCAVFGSRPIQVKWFKERRVLPIRDDYWDGYHYSDEDQCMSFTLVEDYDYGTYRCTVKNEFGEINGVIRVEPFWSLNYVFEKENKADTKTKNLLARSNTIITISVKTLGFEWLEFYQETEIDKRQPVNISYFVEPEFAYKGRWYKNDLNMTIQVLSNPRVHYQNITIRAKSSFEDYIDEFRINVKVFHEESESKNSDSHDHFYYVAGIVVICLIVGIVIVYKKLVVRTTKPTRPTPTRPIVALNIKSAAGFDPAMEVPFCNITLLDDLGEGAFGVVYKAEVFGLPFVEGVCEVALKTVKKEPTEEELVNLSLEINIMWGMKNHPNVVKLLGVCSNKVYPMLIMELCCFGSLKLFLKARRPGEVEEHDELQLFQLVHFAFQASMGMEYLAQNGCIHRDIAARNVLVAENWVIKIADFGLARKLEEKGYYRKLTQGMLPLKWLSYESLQENVYTVQSDVWSFGILMWEIITLGANPYPGTAAKDVFRLLNTGYRMPKPNNCSDSYYSVMMDCWQKEPENRPSFSQLSLTLRRISKEDV